MPKLTYHIMLFSPAQNLEFRMFHVSLLNVNLEVDVEREEMSFVCRMMLKDRPHLSLCLYYTSISPPWSAPVIVLTRESKLKRNQQNFLDQKQAKQHSVFNVFPVHSCEMGHCRLMF